MHRVIRTRISQGYQTSGYPEVQPVMPDLFMGKPLINNIPCRQDCLECEKVCPTSAIHSSGNELTIDLGKCVFCGRCAKVCPNHRIEFTKDFNLACSVRGDLIISNAHLAIPQASVSISQKIFGKSLKLRQVSAGGCGACEADTNVLNTIVYDLSRFGIQFVASPRHADGLLITGPVTKNMELALLKTYEALAEPRLVIAVGACAISGGIYSGHPETNDGVSNLIPVDLFVPGCPPHPITILDGLLRLQGRIR